MMEPIEVPENSVVKCCGILISAALFKHFAQSVNAGKLFRFAERQPDGPVTIETVPDSVALVAAERKRQTEVEGFTPTHDDHHDMFELTAAAIAYAEAASGQVGHANDTSSPVGWPWEESWWKPSTDPVRNLVKAGALLCAEIERIHRARDAESREPETLSNDGRVSLP